MHNIMLHYQQRNRKHLVACDRTSHCTGSSLFRLPFDSSFQRGYESGHLHIRLLLLRSLQVPDLQHHVARHEFYIESVAHGALRLR